MATCRHVVCHSSHTIADIHKHDDTLAFRDGRSQDTVQLLALGLAGLLDRHKGLVEVHDRAVSAANVNTLTQRLKHIVLCQAGLTYPCVSTCTRF